MVGWLLCLFLLTVVGQCLWAVNERSVSLSKFFVEFIKLFWPILIFMISICSRNLLLLRCFLLSKFLYFSIKSLLLGFWSLEYLSNKDLPSLVLVIFHVLSFLWTSCQPLRCESCYGAHSLICILCVLHFSYSYLLFQFCHCLFVLSLAVCFLSLDRCWSCWKSQVFC